MKPTDLHIERATMSGDSPWQRAMQLEGENASLRAENNSLRTSLAARSAQYWELHEAVERLYKTIEGEKREGGR